MKHIVSIISVLLFIGSSLFSDMFLSEGNRDVPVLIEQYAFGPVAAHSYNAKTGSLPFEKCNAEKEVEGAHVKNARFGSVRKISLHSNYFDPLLILHKHSVNLLSSRIKEHADCIAHPINNLPLHIRNCSWLI